MIYSIHTLWGTSDPYPLGHKRSTIHVCFLLLALNDPISDFIKIAHPTGLTRGLGAIRRMTFFAGLLVFLPQKLFVELFKQVLPGKNLVFVTFPIQIMPNINPRRFDCGLPFGKVKMLLPLIKPATQTISFK